MVLLSFAATVFSQTLPPGFSFSYVETGWVEPMGTAFNSTGTKMFVWEKDGRVFVCNWDDVQHKYVKQTTPVLDIHDEVGDWRDHGLTGFALDPNFETNGKIYLLYVVDRYFLFNSTSPGYDPNQNDYLSATIARITSYQTSMSGSDLLAIPGSRTVLLGESATTGIPILYESHGADQLAFAADGTLLASVGDGSSYVEADGGSLPDTYYVQALADGIIRPAENVGSFRAQMLNSFCGKILRIDPVTGDGVSSNPFYDALEPRAPKSRVWALGFRNPFHFSIKPHTGSTDPAAGDVGDIYVGDVGWNLKEEISVIKYGGQNAGWPLYEGLRYNTEYFALETENLDEPNPLYGINGCTEQYFKFKELIKDAGAPGDYTLYNPCDGSVTITGGNPRRFVNYPPSLDWDHQTALTRVPIFNPTGYTPVTIGTPQSGVTGTSFRGICVTGVCYYPYNKYPAEYTNTLFYSDLRGSWLRNSTFPFTNRISDVKEFGDGFGAIVSIKVNPLDSLIYIVELAVPSITRIDYTANRKPVVKMSSNINHGSSPFVVIFTGDQSFDPDGDDITYSWDFGDGSPLVTTPNPSHVFSSIGPDPHKFVVKLTVTDENGASSTDSLMISSNNTPPQITIISPINNTLYDPGPDTLYTLEAVVTDAEHGPDDLHYEWVTTLCHNDQRDDEWGDTTKLSHALIDRRNCTPGDNYFWKFTLKVTDAGGLSSIDSSRIYPSCGGPLPLNLISFSAYAHDKENTLKWITQHEENLSYFEVQRSYNGVDFHNLGRVESTHADLINYYQYIDDNPPGGFVFYRLRMVDNDGRFSYSMIVRVFNGNQKGNEITLYPNPFYDQVSIAANFQNAGPADIRIVDVAGRIIRKMNAQVKEGFNSISINNLADLPDGVYFIEVVQKNQIKRAKLVKR